MSRSSLLEDLLLDAVDRLIHETLSSRIDLYPRGPEAAELPMI